MAVNPFIPNDPRQVYNSGVPNMVPQTQFGLNPTAGMLRGSIFDTNRLQNPSVFGGGIFGEQNQGGNSYLSGLADNKMGASDWMGQSSYDKFMDWNHINPQVDVSNPAAAGSDGSNFWFGGKNKDGSSNLGAANVAVAGLSAGMNAYLGLKKLGIAEDTLKFQKNAFSKQFENQRSLANTAMEDRQRSRFEAVGAGHGVMNSEDYMAKHRL